MDTQTCALLSEEGAATGQKLGDFKAEIDQFSFIEAPEAAGAAAPSQ